MAYFDSLYGKSSNSAPTPTISSSSGGGGYFGSLFSSKPTQTKVATTRPTVSTTQPVKIAPNSTNIFDTIKQDVQKAITIGKNTIVSFVTPKVQPQAPKPVQTSPKTVTILPNQKKLDQSQLQTLKPSFTNTQPTSAQMKTTPQSLASAAKTVAMNKKITSTIDKVLADTFPGTQKALSDLKIDPFSLKSDPHKVLGDVFNSFKEPLMAEKDRIVSYFQAYQHPTSETEKFGKRVQVVTGGANVLFSPISALFSAANDIPVLGTVTKLISLPFTAVGETATKTSDTIIDALPIPKEAKAQIKPGVGEMFALAAQIALGKALDISASKRNELVSKYGVEDTKTILDQAQKLAQGKKGIQEFTPQDVINKVMQNNLEQTPEGKTLIKSAMEAKQNGQNIQIQTKVAESKPIETYAAKPKDLVEKQNLKYIKENPDKIVADYTARVTKEYGVPHVITADEGKYIFPGYEGRLAPQYHEAGSAVAKYMYDQMLNDRKGAGNDTVLFTAGGTGSGKTTALRKAHIDFKDYSIIYDTNLTGESAAGKIKKALDKGYKVNIAYVQRDPVAAFEHGVLPRVRSRDRIVTIDEHISRHKALESVTALKDKFGDKVDVRYIDNTGHNIAPKNVPLENLPKFNYNDNQLVGILNEKLNQAVKEGKITTEEARAISSSEGLGRQLRSSIESQPQGQDNQQVKTPSKIAVSIERKAIEQGLTKGFENIAGYDKITIKDQAAKAESLMSNLDQAGKVIRGEEPLPTGLRGTSLVVAAEQYIKKTGDAQMAYDLANSPLVSGTSAAAQELAMAAQREPDSLALKLQDLKKAREATLQKRTGKTVDKAVKLEVDKIKTEIVKKAPNKYDWGEFIKTIQC